jgi:NAD(P)-dependent dehydrogenase (short-subunit alcohol dehydrogenase family)
VTGGSRGIGRAIARALACEGASVVVASRSEGRGLATEQALRDQGGEVKYIQTDVTQRDQVQRMIRMTLERFGDLNVLINNAGVHDKAPFWEESEALWHRMYRVNVLGTVLPSQAAVRHMKDSTGGAIVHIGSKAAVVGEPGHAAYSASKGAVVALTRAMAVELAPYSIRVNAVCPGPVVTDMLLGDVPTEEGREELAGTAPLSRLGQPEDIASAVLYLASSDSDWCTGQALSVDGGLSILK